MFNFWWRPLTGLGLLVFTALISWAAFSANTALLVFGAGLSLYLFSQLLHLARLSRWLQHPDLEDLPQAGGLWEEIYYSLYRMLRSQSRSQFKLSAVLERFQHAAQAMPDGIVMLTKSDRIEWCNPVAGTHLGLDIERDRGQFIHYLIRQAPFTEYLNAHNYSEPHLIKAPPHPEMTLSIQLVPFGDEQKLLISRDITQLELVDTMRRDFVANVSHEMRTPLTVVGGFLETFAEMEQPLEQAEAQHYFKTMLEETHRMQRLVDDLLTLSRLESPQNHLKKDRVDVPGMLRSLLDEARALSEGRHEVTLLLDSEACVLGSGDELRSAFGNLVSNAVRYTPAGGKITLRWQQKGDETCFSVADTGEGIEAQYLPRLTERFYRIDRSRSRETGGTGLGLAIVKHIVTRHQARLVIASEPGKGSCFSICFFRQNLAALPTLEPVSYSN